MKSGFLKKVLTASDPASAKRLVTLVVAAHFVLTSFLVSFFAFYLVIYTPRGSVNKDLLDLLAKVLENDIIVITGGLAMIGAENLGQIILEKAKAKAAANIKVGAPTADDINIDTVNIEQKLKETEE